jgi:hypothetical protein
MAWLLLITAILLCLAVVAFRQRAEGAILVGVALALVVIGSSATLMTRANERTRIDAHYLGARIPAAAVRDCRQPATARDTQGVWIGAGPRWDGDDSADAVHVPGYRGHLVEICKSGGTIDEILVRVVDPGLSFEDSGKLVPAAELETQRLALGSDDTVIAGLARPSISCLKSVTKSFKTQDVIDMVRNEWDVARKGRRYRGRRERILSTQTPFPPAEQAFCVDIAGSKPAPCRAFDPTSAVFIWRRGLAWHGLAPIGAAFCDCSATPKTPDKKVKPASWSIGQPLPNEIPSISMRMIVHRTAGTLADAAVPVPAGAYSPAGFRVGASRTVAFARLGSDLVLLPEESSVQLRIDDLYGREVRGLPQGKLQLVFDEAEARFPLTLNLGSIADHLAPKPIFANVAADITVPEAREQYVFVGNDGAPRAAAFREIIDLPSGRADGIRPLVVLSRIDVPFGTTGVPIAAVVLFIVVLAMSWSRGDVTSRWILTAVLLVLLSVRFFLAVRGVANAPWSRDMSRSWLVAGCHLLFLPPLLMLLVRFRWRRPPRSGRIQVDAEIFWTAAAAAVAIAWLLLTSAPLKPVIRQLAFEYLAISIALGLALTAYALAMASSGPLFTIAAWLQSLVVRVACWFVRLFRKRFATPASPAAPIGIALVFGVILILVRLGLMFFGAQESIFGARDDVFFIPVAAAVAGAITKMSPRDNGDFRRVAGLGVFLLLAFAVIGVMVNDFGLIFIAAMATVLVLPLVAWRRVRLATGLSAFVLIAVFLSPRLFPSGFAAFMRSTENETTIGPNDELKIPDILHANQPRDYYRMLHAVYPDGVEEMPSQIARQVVVDHERVRYQSLNGAWRESFRATEAARSPMTGSGLLRAKPIVGEATFTDASRSDYVYPLYVRAEFGTVGILALILLYAAVFLAPRHTVTGDRVDAPVGIWALAFAAATSLFMLGGTASVFPFSGKWCLFMAFTSGSDVALGAALFMLAALIKEDW